MKNENIFATINQIVAVGSVDGVLTTAALLRLIGTKTLVANEGESFADHVQRAIALAISATDHVGLVFTQAFTVDKIDVSTWEPNREVAFVDLAVNNRDKAMTAAFVQRVKDAGHKLVAVIDEHDAQDWLDCLGSFEGLFIRPESQEQGEFKSSGAVLAQAVPQSMFLCDAQVRELLADADKADAMDFSGLFASPANQAVKSAMADDSRRIYLARHFAVHARPDSKIQEWIKEYEQILVNHDAIVANQKDLGEGIVRVTATGLAVDMTTLMSRLYQTAKVVVLEGEAFVPAKKTKMLLVVYGTSDKTLDLMAVIKATGISPLGGFAQKVNVALEDEVIATDAIRVFLRQFATATS